MHRRLLRSLRVIAREWRTNDPQSAVNESDSSSWVKGVARERVRLANDPQVKDRSFNASTVARLVLGGSRATYRLRLPITPSLLFEGPPLPLSLSIYPGLQGEYYSSSIITQNAQLRRAALSPVHSKVWNLDLLCVLTLLDQVRY